MLARQAAAAVGVGTCGCWKMLLRCRLLGDARRFGANGRRRGAGAYRGGRPPTACYFRSQTYDGVQFRYLDDAECRRNEKSAQRDANTACAG